MTDTTSILLRNSALRRYVSAKEKIVFATRRHWARLWEPVLSTAAAFVAVAFMTVAVEELAILWVAWCVLAVRLLIKWLDWRQQWFVVTNKRLIVIDGFMDQSGTFVQVDKVTDMQYRRPPLGQLLGYGEFRFESAGQDEVLNLVDYIPDPDERYRQIISAHFLPAEKKEEPKTIFVVHDSAQRGYPAGQPPYEPPATVTQPIPVYPPQADDPSARRGHLPGGPTTSYSETRPPRPFLEGGDR